MPYLPRKKKLKKKLKKIRMLSAIVLLDTLRVNKTHIIKCNKYICQFDISIKFKLLQLYREDQYRFTKLRTHKEHCRKKQLTADVKDKGLDQTACWSVALLFLSIIWELSVTIFIYFE